MRLAWWLGLACLGCGATDAEPPASVACAATYDIVSSPGTRFEDVATSDVVPWPTAGVTFEASVTRVGDAAHVVGVLTNTTDAEATVDYLTGGAMGISTNPFQITVVGETLTATGPEIYRAILPPHGTVTYTSDRCPTFPATIQWTFSPWTGDAVRGEQALP